MALTPYSISSGPLGTSIYLFAGVDAPAQFVPTLTVKATQNNSGTNTNVSVASEYPIVSQVDGVNIAANRFRMETSFTALRSIKSDTERNVLFDEHVAYLIANKAEILKGSARPTGK